MLQRPDGLNGSQKAASEEELRPLGRTDVHAIADSADYDRRMDVGSVAVPLATALIGLIGGYVLAQVQGRLDLAQWRRDRLLQFCADLLAACNEVTDKAQDILNGEDVPYPREEMRRLMHAYQCVHLLSRELDKAASKCGTAHAALLRDAYGRAANPQADPDFMAANLAAGRFASDAHDLLRGIRAKKTANAQPPAAAA
jgi:hypothetical protein